MRRVFKVETYQDDEGREVRVLTGRDDGSVRLRGTAKLRVPGAHPSLPPRECVLDFPFPEGLTDIDQAFETFDETWKEGVKGRDTLPPGTVFPGRPGGA